MKEELLQHVSNAHAAVAEVEQAIHESGSAGHFNEAQIESLKEKLDRSASTVVVEFDKALRKVESYLKPAAKPSEPQPPAPPSQPADLSGAAPQDPAGDQS